MGIGFRSVLAAAIWLASTSAALANFVTFQVQWSGASFGNTATATGFITFDDAALPAVQEFNNEVPLPNPAVADLGITVSGASVGNGTFGVADFWEITFFAPSALDLSTELIGQALTNGCTFGTSTGTCGAGLGGDFNLFSSAGTGAPNGSWYFELMTYAATGEPGDHMLVTSMRPLPEPTTLALLGLGLAGLAATRRRKH